MPLPLNGALNDRVAALASRFDLTPAFVRAYLAPRADIRAAVEAARDEDDLYERLGPLNAMYVRFALSTTERGAAFARYIAPHVALPKRFLDIGCAYGGFLRAWRARGADVVGVELEAEFAALARANLGDDGGQVVHADILACDAASLGRFDLVACNDVIEHVADGRALVRQVAALLEPGGVAYFEIPNPQAISFVASDGHFQQFGLTLLSRPLAERYLHEATGRSYREMGELHDEATYRRWFADAALDVIDVPQPHAQRFDDLHERAFELVNAFTWWHGHQRKELSEDVADAVTARYWSYAASLFAGIDRARQGRDRAAFERRYLSPFWTFVVRRR